MGDNDGSSKRAAGTYNLAGCLFHIDRYEVTMSDYQKLLDHDYSIEPPPSMG